MSLTASQVHHARTSGLTDTYLARIWRVKTGTVFAARRGTTWRDHPTPPDRVPRDSTGSTQTIRAGLPQMAVPRKQRREWR